MKRPSDPSSHQELQDKISREFRRFREEGGGRYPALLRTMSISAIGMGLSRIRVAKAAEISTTTIRNWEASAPKAKQLNVIATSEVISEPLTRSPGEGICIRLTSGVEIDVPRRSLDVEFLEILNSLGGHR